MARRSIAGSRALVTGASGGIGRALAMQLARQGADLLVLARREPELAELAEEVRALGRRCEIIVGDVTQEAVRTAAIARAKEALGGLDLLINNAGIGALGPFEEASPERLRRIMEVNFFAAAELTRASIPLLKQGKRPLIVNIGSILSHVAVPDNSEYCASKFALRGWSHSLRAELKPRGIDVLLVSPASTESDFWRNLIDEQAEPAFRGQPASAELVARRIARAIERGSAESFPTWSAQLVAWGQRLTPRILDWVIARRAQNRASGSKRPSQERP